MAPKRTRRSRGNSTAYPVALLFVIPQVVCYGRVSTDLQREAETIKVQIQKLEGTIRVRENPEFPQKDQLKLVAGFWDDGVSGTIPFEERPEGKKLMSMICPRASLKCQGECGGTGLVHQVWISKLDRLARTLQILINIEAFLGFHNVALVCMDPGFDTSTSSGRLVFTVLGAIAEWERLTILERTTEGKHQKARDGHFVGGRRTFGLKTDENGYLVIDDTFIEQCGEMAYRVVQTVFENIALHDSTTLRESRRTGLSERRIGIMLHNPRYKGDGGIYDADGNWTAAEKNLPPQIVSPTLWDMAQEALSKNRKHSGGKPHHEYLLSGLLVCCEPFTHTTVVDEDGSSRGRTKIEGLCGRTFAGRIERRPRKAGRIFSYGYYYCTRTLKREATANQQGCTARMLPINTIEPVIWDLVRRCISNPQDVLEQADSGRSDMIAQLQRELTATVTSLAGFTDERENVLQSVERRLRTREAGEARIAEIDEQIALADEQRKALEVQLRSLSYSELDAKRSQITIRDIVARLDQIDAEDDVAAKKTLIQAVVKRIEVRTVDGAPRLRVALRFGGDIDTLLRTDPHSGKEPQNDTQGPTPVLLEIELCTTRLPRVG